MHLYDSPLRESRAAREPELPGAPAVGTSLGHLSHITAKSKKLPENGVNYCLPKIVMKGEETQSWVRPPYASSHRELLEGPVFTLLTADFFFSQEGTFSLNLLSAFCVFDCLPSKRAANPPQVHTEVQTIFFPSQLGLRQPGEVVLLYTLNTQNHIQQGVKRKY